MSETPNELFYAKSHEWVRREEDGTLTVGITDHAQEALGDIVFVETPEVGDAIAAGDQAGVVESTKSASDIYAPVSGEVISVNEELADGPELVNAEPYTEGWFFKIQPDDMGELDGLMAADEYAEFCDNED